METATAVNAFEPFADQNRNWEVFAGTYGGQTLDKALSIDDAIEHVTAQAAADGQRADRENVDLSGCTLIANGNTPLLASKQGNYLPLRQTAYNQLCSLAGAPAQYMSKLPVELAAKCVNHGLARYEGAPVTLRAVKTPHDGWQTRGIVSGRHAGPAMDDTPVLETVRRALNHMGLAEHVAVVAIATGSVTNLRIVFKQSIDGPDGQPLTIGFDLRNGELGGSSLRLSSVIYRMICTNGIVSANNIGGERWRHVGDGSALFDNFERTIPDIMDHAALLPRLVNAAAETVVTIKQAETRLARTSLNTAQRRVVLSNALAYADDCVTAAGVGLISRDLLASTDVQNRLISMWNVINGVTEAAQTVGSHEARLTIETEASRLLAA